MLDKKSHLKNTINYDILSESKQIILDPLFFCFDA